VAAVSALVDKYQGDPGRHHGSCRWIGRASGCDGTERVKLASGGGGRHLP